MDEERDRVSDIPVAPAGGNTKLWYDRLTSSQKAAYMRARNKTLSQHSRSEVNSSCGDF